MSPVIRRLVEVVLMIEHIDRSVAFYRDVLGLKAFSPDGLPVKFLRIDPAHDGIPQPIVLVPQTMLSDQPLPHSV